MQQILKENITYIILVLIILVGGLFLVIPKMPETFHAALNTYKLKKEYETTNTQLEQLKMEVINRSVPVVEGGKKIYEAQGMQFSADASFAPLFESVINVARASGIRFRSIKYNYEPTDDMVYAAKLSGYNVCELDIIAIGSYAQFQDFFKGLIRGEYLNNLAEIEITPFADDKSILINNMKLRLYTKTADADPGAAVGDPNGTDF